MKEKKPNLLIAGVSHGGTTSLFSYLSSHPEICASTIKETHYFSPILNGETVSSIEEYQKFFLHHDNEPYVMEAGPGYLYGGNELAGKVKELLREVRLVFILREPVSRLYSYFKYCSKAMQVVNISFNDFVKLLEKQSQKNDLIKSKKIGAERKSVVTVEFSKHLPMDFMRNIFQNGTILLMKNQLRSYSLTISGKIPPT